MQKGVIDFFLGSKNPCFYNKPNSLLRFNVYFKKSINILSIHHQKHFLFKIQPYSYKIFCRSRIILLLATNMESPPKAKKKKLNVTETPKIKKGTLNVICIEALLQQAIRGIESRQQSTLGFLKFLVNFRN
jgi:hypothetical protein